MARTDTEILRSEVYREVTRRAKVESDYIELQRHAIAVTRMWGMLSRCQDEFLPEDPGACGELHDRLDVAIDGLMKLADREMWDRRQAWMREAATPPAPPATTTEGE